MSVEGIGAPSPELHGDSTFRMIGASLLLLGFAGAIYGFVILAGCDAYYNGACVGHSDLVGGIVLGTLGLMVSAGGAILYLVERRASSPRA